MIGVDSTFLIDLMRNHEHALLKAQDLDLETMLFTTQMNVYEVLKGIHYFDPHLRTRQYALAQEMLDDFIVLDIDRRATHLAAKLSGNLMRKGLRLNDGDILIAGTLLAHGCTTIVTNDDHFTRIAELKVENY